MCRTITLIACCLRAWSDRECFEGRKMQGLFLGVGDLLSSWTIRKKHIWCIYDIYGTFLLWVKVFFNSVHSERSCKNVMCSKYWKHETSRVQNAKKQNKTTTLENNWKNTLRQIGPPLRQFHEIMKFKTFESVSISKTMTLCTGRTAAAPLLLFVINFLKENDLFE